MSYQIGQYRFEGENWCLGDISNSAVLKEKTLPGAQLSFTDMAIELKDGNFSSKKSYYLNVKIPQDLSYDLGFTLKLMGPGTSDADLLRYQTLGTVFVPKNGDGSNSYRVVLYRSIFSTDDNEVIKASIPTEKPVIDAEAVADGLYYTIDKATGKYRYWVGNSPDGTGCTSIDAFGNPSPYNEMFISATWHQDVSDDYPSIYFNTVFTPILDTFNQLVFEMTRTGDDFNIQHTDTNGNTTYGRVVPLNKVEYTLSEVRDLLTTRIKHTPLSKIAVQSHSGLLMCINGEEIKVGPSRLYEFDAIPIETLGIVAHGYEDNFIIDYKYEV